MKRVKRNIILMLVLSIIILAIMSTKVFAAGIGMSINKNSGYIGDTFRITISGIYGKVSISCNSNISLNISGTQFIENGSITLTGTAKSVGTGTVTVTPIDAVTTGANPQEVTTPASVSIAIKKKETPKPSTTTQKTVTTKPTTSTSDNKTEEKEDDFYITKLTVKGVKENGEKVDIKLSPKFSKNVYKYSCKVESDIQKIELIKDAGNYTKYIKVDGLKELKEGKNTITLKLVADGQKSKKYIIEVTKELATVKTSNELQTDNTIIETDDTKSEKESRIVSMQLGEFIALEVGIIIIEAAIFCLVFRKKLFSRKH